MINTVAQTKPTSEELRAEVNELALNGGPPDSKPLAYEEKCALEDLISHGTSKPTKS
jgi:hypothetical protein